MSTLFMSWQLSVPFFPVDSITAASCAVATKIIYAFPPRIAAVPQFYGLIRCNIQQQASQSVEASGPFLDRPGSFKSGVLEEEWELWRCICRAINQHKWAASLCQQRVGCADGFLLSSLQIGGRRRLASIQVHTLPEFSGILASLPTCPWSNAQLLLFSGEEREAAFLFTATGPPTTSSTSAAHPKLARASTAPRLSIARTASPALFSRNNCV